MRYTLKPYQETASADIKTRIEKASTFLDTNTRTAFALAAPTGSGKTVIAADVLETLIQGNDETPPSDNLTIIWFSDSPDLNLQSRYRIEEASSQLYGNLIDITPNFSETELSPGTCYFINTQKFSKNSLLVRRPTTPQQSPEDNLFGIIPPDKRQIGIWEIIANTINNPDKNVLLIIDEAHRGLGVNNKERSTILKNLINGHVTPTGTKVPPMPIVWGISATPQRFRDYINSIVQDDMITMPDVVIDPATVQQSGLLKETIILSIPGEKGDYRSNLLAEATQKLKNMSTLWSQYCHKEDITPVHPLMVIQVENNVTEKSISEYIQAVKNIWDLPDDSFAHVFGEHSPIKTPSMTVPYISPEKVQDSTWVKVVFAKEAISTGWDCPRAEVLVSFRSATDDTHITQILGRMVRNPLARTIPGDDVLNSTTCILPKFREEAALRVATMLSRDDNNQQDLDGTGGGSGRKVLVNAEILTPHDCDKELEVLTSLPSYHIPTRTARPITRALNLATELEKDGLYENAEDEISLKLCKKLDGLYATYKSEVDEHLRDIMNIEITVLSKDVVGSGEVASETVELTADSNALNAAYAGASKSFTKQLSADYVQYLLKKRLAEDPDEDVEDVLVDLRTLTAAMSRVPEIVEGVTSDAERIAVDLTDEHRIDIDLLSDSRVNAYNFLRDLSPAPVQVGVVAPVSEAAGGRTSQSHRYYENHLLSNDDGKAPFVFNSWEKHVVSVEASRRGFTRFYRNPDKGKAESGVSIPYVDSSGAYKVLRPDFIFFYVDGAGDVVASIVDPHGSHLSDAVYKLRGMADYAEKHGDSFHRIESIALVGGEYRGINVKDAAVRAALKSMSVEDLYNDPKLSFVYK